MFKNRGVTIAVVAVAILLSGVAIFTAARIFTARRAQQQAAPTVAPESRPTVTDESEELTFNVGPTIPPTPTPTSAAASPTAKASSSPSSFGGLTGSSTPTASPKPTASPTAKPSSTASATPTAAPQLPEAGVATPTIIGIATGSLLLLLALVFAL